MISDYAKKQLVGSPVSPQLIASSIILVLVVIFYIYAIGTYFGIDVFPLKDRNNYLESFSMIVFEKNVDDIIVISSTTLWLGLSLVGRTRIIVSSIYGVLALVSILLHQNFIQDLLLLTSIPLIFSLLIIYKVSSKKILHVSNRISLNYMAIFGFVTSFISIVVSLGWWSFAGNTPQDHAYEIFLLFSTLSPFLILVLIVYSPIRLLRIKLTNSIVGNHTSAVHSPSRLIDFKIKVLAVSLFMVLSVILVLVSHQSSINHNYGTVGADTGNYVGMLNSIMPTNGSSISTQDSFARYMKDDRPISLLFLMMIVKVMPVDRTYAVDHTPIILAPILVLVVYFLTRQLTSNDTTALLGSFLTAISFQTLIGIYSGLYANWLALIFGYMSLVFLIKFVKNPSKLNLAMFGVFLLLLLFSHAYTWTILVIFMFILLGVFYKFNHYKKRTLFLLALVLTASVIVDVARTEVTGNPAGIERDLSLAQGGAGVNQFSQIWTNLTGTLLNYSGGQFGNFPMLALGIFWLFWCTSRNLPSIFLLCFLAIGILPLLFGNTLLQTRVLYDIPLQIPAAIALTYISRRYHGTLVALSICVWIFAMSIKAVTNF